MIECPECNLIYKDKINDVPDKCVICGKDLTIEKEKEFKKEENEKYLYEWRIWNEDKQEKKRLEQIKIEQKRKIKRRNQVLSKLRCSKCESSNVKITERNSLPKLYIKCNDCGNFDSRESYDETTERVSGLVKCDLCNSKITGISPETGLPDWHYTDFEYIKNKVLCSKCDYEHFEELEEKDEEVHKKHLVIEYMFDGDALKYWEQGNEGSDFKEIEVDNDDGKQRYKRAIKKMKHEYPKTTKFIDIDE